MEGSSRLNSLSSRSRSAAKEEKSAESVAHKESCTQESSKEDELELAKAKMKEVREENARLKMMLEKIEKDYKSLQKRFLDSVNEEEAKNKNKSNNNNNNAACSSTIEEPEFIVSLRLGTSPSTELKKDLDDNNNIIISSFSKSTTATEDDHDEQYLKCGLKLGLDYHLGGSSKSGPTVGQVSPENYSLEEIRKNHEDVNAGLETWPPISKALKTGRTSEDDELSQQSNPKRARVSVRARCDTPTMNDGCQWRKYGQKISKGNPCPRAYYRCTVAPACPVRKQVQRCAEDMSILITTYEGTHNHPLNLSATAMASTTSAAASMLLSGSSSSQPPGLGLTPATTNLHGLNVYLSRDISRTRSPFYLPTTSSPTFPTITLDLTATTPFNIFSSTNFQSTPTPFPSNNLNFSSFESNNITPTLWGNGYLNNYGKLSYNKPHVGSLNLIGGPAAQEQLYHSYLEKNHQQPSTETITKALTSDPSFQSVIAAAISSMVGGGSGGRLGQNLKWGESTVPAISSTPVSLNAKGCASTYLTQSSSSSSLSGSLNAVQPTSLPFSVSKATSAIAKSGDQTKP